MELNSESVEIAVCYVNVLKEAGTAHLQRDRKFRRLNFRHKEIAPYRYFAILKFRGMKNFRSTEKLPFKFSNSSFSAFRMNYCTDTVQTKCILLTT